jgi:HK97 family phage prohead protease
MKLLSEIRTPQRQAQGGVSGLQEDLHGVAIRMPAGTREIRTVRATELRASKEGDKQYLSGYAATFNTMSSPLGYFRERILPGAFDRALKEKQDVRHLINHDVNRVLGRTAAGTTELSADSKGLKFRTLMPDTTYARDLAVSVERGDVNECSFGFMVNHQDRDNPGATWSQIPDPDDPSQLVALRDLSDVDLEDVSTVTYPAYPKTSAGIEHSLWPDGVPAEVRSHIKRSGGGAGAGTCGCSCQNCLNGNCADCSNEDCDDENCRDCGMRSIPLAIEKRAEGKTVSDDSETKSLEAWRERAAMRLRLGQH